MAVFGGLPLAKNPSVFEEFGSRVPPGAVFFTLFGGSSAPELDSTRFLMTGGRDERPSPENHGSDHAKTL